MSKADIRYCNSFHAGVRASIRLNQCSKLWSWWNTPLSAYWADRRPSISIWWTKERCVQVTAATVGQITEFRFFSENQFFLDPNFLASLIMVWRGHLCSICWSKLWFWCKIGSENVIRSTNIWSMTPQKPWSCIYK